MTDLLNFNPDRKLEFDMTRPLEFDARRPLEFDPGRGLEFLPNRDLGFGRRGVVFRGYVCPICRSLVTEDATRCTECGTVFEGTPRAAGPTVPAKPPASMGSSPSTASPKPSHGATPGPGMVYCAYCGVKLKRADAFCWNCGARTAGFSETVKLPGQKTIPATREWKKER